MSSCGHVLDPAAAADAGIVEQHMHAPARGLAERLHRARPAGALAHVERHGDALAFRQARRGFFEPLRIDVEQADEPAALGEQLRGGAADAGTGAGDEDGFLFAAHAAFRPPNRARRQAGRSVRRSAAGGAP